MTGSLSLNVDQSMFPVAFAAYCALATEGSVVVAAARSIVMTNTRRKAIPTGISRPPAQRDSVESAPSTVRSGEKARASRGLGSGRVFGQREPRFAGHTLPMSSPVHHEAAKHGARAWPAHCSGAAPIMQTLRVLGFLTLVAAAACGTSSGDGTLAQATDPASPAACTTAQDCNPQECVCTDGETTASGTVCSGGR